MVLTQPSMTMESTSSRREVSIPLWFSRNWPSEHRKHDCETLVSIPLWFSRNPEQVVDNHIFWSQSFHTTMVLTQRGNARAEGETHKKFPYHYGSHATKLLTMQVKVWL